MGILIKTAFFTMDTVFKNIDLVFLSIKAFFQGHIGPYMDSLTFPYQ